MSSVTINENDKVVLVVFYPDEDESRDLVENDNYLPSFLDNIKYCISALITKLKLYHGNNSTIYIITKGQTTHEVQVNSNALHSTPSQRVIKIIKDACDDKAFANNCHYNEKYNSENIIINNVLKEADKVLVVGNNINDTFKNFAYKYNEENGKNIYVIKKMSINYKPDRSYTGIGRNINNVSNFNSVHIENYKKIKSRNN